MEFLLFRLYGPLASWGSTAVGGTRPSHTMPTRSAILGLLAASLGIRRSDQVALDALTASVNMAVKAESVGVLLRDYHTAQVPSTDKKAIWNHRKAETENIKGELNTVLSTRDYRADGLWVVALSEKTGAEFSLNRIMLALKEPVFPLYLGRKSCPLAAPLQPQMLNADNFADAFDVTFHPVAMHAEAQKTLQQDLMVYQWDKEDSGFPHAERFEQWDEPGVRSRWQFEKRVVYSKRIARSR